MENKLSLKQMVTSVYYLASVLISLCKVFSSDAVGHSLRLFVYVWQCREKILKAPLYGCSIPFLGKCSCDTVCNWSDLTAGISRNGMRSLQLMFLWAVVGFLNSCNQKTTIVALKSGSALFCLLSFSTCLFTCSFSMPLKRDNVSFKMGCVPSRGSSALPGTVSDIW